MRKKLVTLLLAFIWTLLPMQVFAHSKLVESNPAANSIVTEDISEIKLVFNTTIEENAKVTLRDEQGKEIKTESPQVKGKELTAKVIEPLPNGKISVSWTIIGADGHVIQNQYVFTADKKEQVTPNETPQSATLEKEENTTAEANNSSFLWLIVLGIGLIALAFIVLLVRKRK